MDGGGRRITKRPRYLTLPIVLVLSVIGYLYSTTVFVVVDGWLGLGTAAGVANAVAFTALASMVLSTYASAVLGDPGRVPSSFRPDADEPSSPVYEIKRKSGDMRYCQKCSHYKPPRAHHCRVCKTCVLKMDHHCVWINNCVGHANHKPFFVFILYSVIASIYSTVLLIGSALHDAHKDHQHNGGSYKATFIINAALLLPLTVALTVLLAWHLYLISHNKTTIEYHEGVRALWMEEKTGTLYSHPYDIGVYENLATVLGNNACSWIFPTTNHLGSGLQFKTIYDRSLPLSTGGISGYQVVRT